MKGICKRLLALVLILVQLPLLFGCAALDRMRANHAFIDEATHYIHWDGKVYRPLSYGKYLTVEPRERVYVYATAPDVPVLLSDTFYDKMLLPTDDHLILRDIQNGVFYCEESSYDAIWERIKAPFVPDTVCYSYQTYDKQTHEFGTAYYHLTDEQIQAIELVASQTEPTVLTQGMYMRYDWTVTLEECSEDMLFRKASCRISQSENTYYLRVITDSGEVLFTVPSGCNAIFREITKAYTAPVFEFEEEDGV